MIISFSRSFFHSHSHPISSPSLALPSSWENPNQRSWILNIHNFFLIHRRLCVWVDWGMKADVRVSATFFLLLLNFEIRDKIIFTIRIRDGKFPFYPNQVYFISEKFPDIFMTDLLLVNFVPLRWRTFLDFLEPSRLGFIDEFVWAELDKVAIEFFSKSTHPENNITKK